MNRPSQSLARRYPRPTRGDTGIQQQLEAQDEEEATEEAQQLEEDPVQNEEEAVIKGEEE